MSHGTKVQGDIRLCAGIYINGVELNRKKSTKCPSVCVSVN